MASMKRATGLLAITASLALLTGCATTTGANPKPSDTPVAKVYDSAPLTGIKFEQGTNTNLAGPSVACKVDNLDIARPQINLNRTDIVFDEMVEGGLTRFIAVFHSDKPDAVGPVRSIRPMDPDIISMFGGIVCYSGGQLKFVKMMKATAVFNANETEEQGKGTFTRAKDRQAPHNVIVNVAKLAAAHPDLAAPQAIFTFAADAATSSAGSAGAGVKSFKVYYPSALAEWVWDSKAGVWLRNQDGKLDTDKADGSTLSTTNVVVMKVNVDHQYGHVPKDLVIGTGTATVFTDGKMVTGTWAKSSQTAPIVLTDAAGKTITLAPGRTWVELQPNESEGGKLKVTLAPAPTPAPTK
jgi:hypothetical protein